MWDILSCGRGGVSRGVRASGVEEYILNVYEESPPGIWGVDSMPEGLLPAAVVKVENVRDFILIFNNED